jgi:hypothetical protein
LVRVLPSTVTIQVAPTGDLARRITGEDHGFVPSERYIDTGKEYIVSFRSLPEFLEVLGFVL